MFEAAKPGTQPVVLVKNVYKEYNLGETRIPVLRDVSLRVAPGEFAAIVGASGNGKSTLLNMITGIDHPTSGDVVVNGTPIHTLDENRLAIWRGAALGIVFQFFQLLPALNLLQNVILPMDFTRALPRSARKRRAMDLLDMVGLADQAHKLPGQISGGQQQRAAIARALANDPPLIVADEPTGNLDAHTSADVFEIFCRLVEQGKTLIMVTHNQELACRAGRRIEITNGRIVSDGECEDQPGTNAQRLVNRPQ
jgi:putative ABC transport system ATP-binding protein